MFLKSSSSSLCGLVYSTVPVSELHFFYLLYPFLNSSKQLSPLLEAQCHSIYSLLCLKPCCVLSAVFNRHVSFDVTLHRSRSVAGVGGGPDSDQTNYFWRTVTFSFTVDSGCVHVHVSKCMLFPWSCGPDTENAASLRCVSCLHFHLAPFSVLHFLPSSTSH